MRLFQLFGVGEKRIFAGGCTAEGTVKKVTQCWWLKVNTKPVRAHMWDGAVYPHIIDFTYTVAGKEYVGRRYVNWNYSCPQVNARICVYYDREEPARYAVKLV